MFFSQSKTREFHTLQALPADPSGSTKMSAKCLHLQEVMPKRITGDYSTEEGSLGVSDLVVASTIS
jgi:hypothetical protein